jgi:hypothetical protein
VEIILWLRKRTLDIGGLPGTSDRAWINQYEFGLDPSQNLNKQVGASAKPGCATQFYVVGIVSVVAVVTVV